MNTGGIDYSVFAFSSFMKNCRSLLLLGSKPVFAINQHSQYLISWNFTKSQHHPHHTYRSLWSPYKSCHGALKGIPFQPVWHRYGTAGIRKTRPKCDTCLSFPEAQLYHAYYYWMPGKEKNRSRVLSSAHTVRGKRSHCEHKGKVLSEQEVTSTPPPRGGTTVYSPEKIQGVYVF